MLVFVKEFVLHKLSQLHKMCGDGGKQLIIFIYLLNNGIVALYPDCLPLHMVHYSMGMTCLDPSFWCIFRFLSDINQNEPMLLFVSEPKHCLSSPVLCFSELVLGSPSSNPICPPMLSSFCCLRQQHLTLGNFTSCS